MNVSRFPAVAYIMRMCKARMEGPKLRSVAPEAVHTLRIE